MSWSGAERQDNDRFHCAMTLDEEMEELKSALDRLSEYVGLSQNLIDHYDILRNSVATSCSSLVIPRA